LRKSTQQRLEVPSAVFVVGLVRHGNES
jgi:hypothetical protein